jgi:hypothetical protein
MQTSFSSLLSVGLPFCTTSPFVQASSEVANSQRTEKTLGGDTVKSKP